MLLCFFIKDNALKAVKSSQKTKQQCLVFAIAGLKKAINSFF
jgi:hypothetical protein